ncbi:MAG: PstS family phosphate ABC transporter substrate-binding protein [Cryobacterium sp.]
MSLLSLKTASISASVLAAALLLTACGGQTATTSSDPDAGLSGSVSIDGSSTVAPLSEAAADLFRDIEPDVNVTVATSGTGGGFKSFCAGETDISDASREIKDEEAAACEANGIEYTRVVMANDGLSVAVSNDNDWATCLTTDQLATAWSPESEGTVMSWNQLDSSFPDEDLKLFGAGTDSGTFDYFTEAINGESGAIRTDFSPSEDDNIIVQGVAGNPGGMGFFGLSYVEENTDQIRALEIDSGDGCVAPTSDTVQDGSYTPLGRPLFIYVNNAAYAEKPQMRSFIDFYVENEDDIAEASLFIGLTEEQKVTAEEQLATLVS